MMYTLLGLCLLIITLAVGVQDRSLFLHNSLPPPSAGYRLPGGEGFSQLLRPWSAPVDLIGIEAPRDDSLPPEMAEPVATLTPEPNLPVFARHHKEVDASIRRYARQYGLEERLVQAVIDHESRFKSGAVSPKGAAGLMQLMPKTAALVGVKNALDTRQNIAGGVKYLKMCLNRFDQDVGLALAAYNAGPGKVEKYADCPPFPETQKFVAQVLARCYGRDWPRKTRVRLPDQAFLAQTDAGRTGARRKITAAAKAYGISAERQVLASAWHLSLPLLKAKP
jgi:hypothetical protein